jgi:hypothetical protein
MLNQCIKEPHSNLAVFVMQRGGRGVRTHAHARAHNTHTTQDNTHEHQNKPHARGSRRTH